DLFRRICRDSGPRFPNSWLGSSPAVSQPVPHIPAQVSSDSVDRNNRMLCLDPLSRSIPFSKHRPIKFFEKHRRLALSLPQYATFPGSESETRVRDKNRFRRSNPGNPRTRHPEKAGSFRKPPRLQADSPEIFFRALEIGSRHRDSPRQLRCRNIRSDTTSRNQQNWHIVLLAPTAQN